MWKTPKAAPALTLLLPTLLLAACTPADPLELPGCYDVHTAAATAVPNPEASGEPIAAQAFVPSSDGGATIADGPFGLVVFMPGFGATYSGYRNYMEHLVSHGSIVVGMNFRLPGGVDGRHDYLARQTTYVLDHFLAPGGPLDGHVDPARVATAGHSLGGKIAFYAAAVDDRIDVVMAFDPSNSGGPPCFISEQWCNAYPVAPNIVTGAIGLLDDVEAASFIMRAAPDAFNPDDRSNAEHFFYGLDGEGTHGVPSPALYFDMGDAGHASWVNPLAADVVRIAKRTTAAWLEAHFYGGAMDFYFTGGIVLEDVAAGRIAAVETR